MMRTGVGIWVYGVNMPPSIMMSYMDVALGEGTWGIY